MILYQLFLVIEEQIRELQVELNSKWDELESLELIERKDVDFINCNYERINGLCIRNLNKHLLSVIISYLDLDGGINRICKYWSYLVSLNKINLASGKKNL